MGDVVERTFGGYTIQIDRLLCVGFGDCIDEAPDGFEFDDDGIVKFAEDAATTIPERWRKACESCPVDALVMLEVEPVKDGS